MATAEVKWKIVGLKGRYCNSCLITLRDFRLQRYDILPMCREDLDQFLHNGDMDRVKKMMQAKEAKMSDPEKPAASTAEDDFPDVILRGVSEEEFIEAVREGGLVVEPDPESSAHVITNPKNQGEIE